MSLGQFISGRRKHPHSPTYQKEILMAIIISQARSSTIPLKIWIPLVIRKYRTQSRFVLIF